MPKDADCFAPQLAKCKHLNLVGTFTHLASSEVLTDTELGQQTKQQIDRFYSTIERLPSLGADPGILPIAISPSIAARPATWDNTWIPHAPPSSNPPHQLLPPPHYAP